MVRQRNAGHSATKWPVAQHMRGLLRVIHDRCGRSHASMSVRYCPKADKWADVLGRPLSATSRHNAVQQKSPLFNHLVGALLEEQRNIEAERLGGLDIDRKRELNGELDGKLARLCALENAIDVGC